MVKLTRLTNWAMNSTAADVVLRQRARSVFYRAGLFRHLPLTGLMLEVGSGTGHLGEAVLRRMPSRQCVMVDPVQRPPRGLTRRMATRDFCAARADPAMLPFAPARFDAAWASFALQSLALVAQEHAVAELGRVVRPGGTLVLVEDVLRDTQAATQGGHHRSAIEWRALLSRQGWQHQDEIELTWLFPPARLRIMRRRAFICRRAMQAAS